MTHKPVHCCDGCGRDTTNTRRLCLLCRTNGREADTENIDRRPLPPYWVARLEDAEEQED